eukprot:4820030-Ditylum_brightwellii.AAC.1
MVHCSSCRSNENVVHRQRSREGVANAKESNVFLTKGEYKAGRGSHSTKVQMRGSVLVAQRH